MIVNYTHRRFAFGLVGGDQASASLFLISLTDPLTYDITKGNGITSTPSSSIASRTTTTPTKETDRHRGTCIPQVIGWRRPVTPDQPSGSHVKLTYGTPGTVCAILPLPLLSPSSLEASLKSVPANCDNNYCDEDTKGEGEEVGIVATMKAKTQQLAICYAGGRLQCTISAPFCSLTLLGPPSPYENVKICVYVYAKVVLFFQVTKYVP
jgi:hypothetical protein